MTLVLLFLIGRSLGGNLGLDHGLAGLLLGGGSSLGGKTYAQDVDTHALHLLGGGGVGNGYLTTDGVELHEAVEGVTLPALAALQEDVLTLGESLALLLGELHAIDGGDERLAVIGQTGVTVFVETGKHVEDGLAGDADDTLGGLVNTDKVILLSLLAVNGTLDGDLAAGVEVGVSVDTLALAVLPCGLLEEVLDALLGVDLVAIEEQAGLRGILLVEDLLVLLGVSLDPPKLTFLGGNCAESVHTGDILGGTEDHAGGHLTVGELGRQVGLLLDLLTGNTGSLLEGVPVHLVEVGFDFCVKLFHCLIVVNILCHNGKKLKS